MRRNFLLLMLGIGVLFCNALASDAPARSDAEIRRIITDRIDHQRQSLGIVVGVIEPAGRRVVAYGSLDKNDKRPLNGDTIFEIGTVTKVFTALLLADMAQHREVALTDPVAKYLPKTVKMPELGRPINLQDLATHTSGLPMMPANLAAKDPNNPYADYTVKQLYEFLSGYKLDREPGSEWRYSNLGAGLLGHALALRAGMSYEALVRSRIAVPLGMKSTGITLTEEMKARLAGGHNGRLESVPNWNFQVLAGAGALRSSANDLLSFLAAALGYSISPLAPAMAAMVKVRRPTTMNGIENALGWQISAIDGNEIIRKDGASNGYGAFIAYSPESRVGVVVLSNAFTLLGVGDIGLHLLDPSYPLRGRDQQEVTVDQKIFDGYVGSYELAPKVFINVTREGSHFFAQTTGHAKYPIFAESDRNYFFGAMDAQLSFETDSQGRGTAVTMYYNGVGQRAKRIEGPPPERK